MKIIKFGRVLVEDKTITVSGFTFDGKRNCNFLEGGKLAMKEAIKKLKQQIKGK